MDLSIILPSRNELFLNKTIKDILEKAVCEIEVMVVVDEKWPQEIDREIIKDKRIIYIHPGEPRGMRLGINAAVALARGKYIMKTDGHCLFAPEFDKVLIGNHLEDNWVQIPRRYSLDGPSWKVDRKKMYRDYHYLCFPDPHKDHDQGMHGVEWLARTRERKDDHKFDIDDTMSFQGSCWFTRKDWFTNFLGGLDENPVFAGWAQEPTEIGLKTWLGGGKVKINKKIWYAHLHKGDAYGRGYYWNRDKIIKGHNWAADYWMRNLWPKAIHKIDWLVEKFWPVPTWPEDRSLWVSPLSQIK